MNLYTPRESATFVVELPDLRSSRIKNTLRGEANVRLAIFLIREEYKEIKDAKL